MCHPWTNERQALVKPRLLLAGQLMHLGAKQSKLLQSIIYNSRYPLNKEARRERGQPSKYDVNNGKINVDNHPITIARGRLGGYWGSGIREGHQGESGRAACLGGDLRGKIKASHCLMLWLQKGRYKHRLYINRNTVSLKK